MSYHASNLGMYAHSISKDVNGFIPGAHDGPWDLDYDYGMEQTHDEDGGLTEYGEWWEDERWPEIVAEAVAATARSEAALAECQERRLLP